MESRHGEGQTDKQGLFREKGVTEYLQIYTYLDGQPVKSSEEGET